MRFSFCLIWGWFLWLLPTALTAQHATEIHVAQDGSGDYTHIQAAIDACKSFPDQPITIFIADGVYEEKVVVPAWNPHLTLKGESREGTIIRYGDHFGQIDRGRNSTFMTATLEVQARDFRAETLTIENTAGPVGQALAVSVSGDRCVFIDCHFIGYQDTLYVAGAGHRQYYLRCLIEGSTDFIFGEATAVFDRCDLLAKANSFLTAASTPEGVAHGLVFLDGSLRAQPGIDAVYLGRPWRDYARTVWIRCDMGDHILPIGWDNWNSEQREQTTFYAEYASTGPGAAPDARANWSHQLTKKQARAYTPQQILGDWVSDVIAD
jgi:pectinesterase